MSVVYAPEAEEDLAEQLAWLAERNPVAARRLMTRIEALVEALDSGLLDGAEQELTTGERVRSWPLRPLRVYYRRDDDTLHVLRVYHQRRRPIVVR